MHNAMALPAGTHQTPCTPSAHPCARGSIIIVNGATIMSEFKQLGTRPTSSPRSGFCARLADVFSRATERWQRNRAAAALNRLDDRLLENIGISRNDIPRVAAGLVPSNIKTSTQDSRISADAARLLGAARYQ